MIKNLSHPLNSLGRYTISVIDKLGLLGVFFFRSLILVFRYPFQLSKIKNEVYFIGAKSMLVICLTGAFTGMVLGFQGYYTLVKFGSTGFLGGMVALTLIREMGPVLAAIMVTARAGSAIAAEIGIMRISEQIDALHTMDINPVRFLVSPKLAAALISFPLLTALCDVVGIFGGYVTGSILLGSNPGTYFSSIYSSVGMPDITGGFVKSIVFAIVVCTICCFNGYFTHRSGVFGAKGVSLSTTSAVVQSCVLILITDYILTSFLI